MAVLDDFRGFGSENLQNSDFSTIFEESGNFEKRLAVAVSDIVDLSTIFVSNPHWAVDGAGSGVMLPFTCPDSVSSNSENSQIEG